MIEDTAGERSALAEIRAGDMLRRLVDLVSHRTGTVVAQMEEANVTLAQVLLMSRVERWGSASLCELTRASSASAAAHSQMVERLVRQGLLTRSENPVDRRRKTIRLTRRARALLRKLEAARSADYQVGLGALSRQLRERLAGALEPIVAEIENASAPRRAPDAIGGDRATREVLG